MTETLSDLVSKLERAHASFCETLVELGETDRLDARPQPDEWNAREVTAHQVASERWMRDVAAQICDGIPPMLGAGSPDGGTGPMAEFEALPLAALVQLLESEREATLRLLAHRKDADLSRAAGRTPWGDELTLGRWLAALAAHQAQHTAQLGAILRAAVAS